MTKICPSAVAHPPTPTSSGQILNFAFFLLAWLLSSSASHAEAKASVTAFAVEVFKACIDAGISGQPFTENDVLAITNRHNALDADHSIAAWPSEVNLETGEDYVCVVSIDRWRYDPVAFRAELESLKATSWDGRMNSCRWVSKPSPLASGLSCVIVGAKHGSGARYSFSVMLLVIARGPVVMALEPTLIFDANGYARTGSSN